MKNTNISLSAVLAVVALPLNSFAVVITNTRAPVIVPFSAALGAAPAIQSPASPLSLIASAALAPSLASMPVPLPASIQPMTRPVPVAAHASALTQTAQGVAAAIEAAGDLARAGTTDAREHGGTRHALPSGEKSAPAVSADLTAPAAARVPAPTLFDRVASVRLTTTPPRSCRGWSPRLLPSRYRPRRRLGQLRRARWSASAG